MIEEAGPSEDDIEIRVFSKDHLPVLQIHHFLDQGTRTIFWRGRLSWRETFRFWTSALRELAGIFNIPPSSLAKYVITYCDELEATSIRMIDRDLASQEYHSEWLVKSEYHREFISDKLNRINFVRFDRDIDAFNKDPSRDLKFIFWCDLVFNEDSEIGFTSPIIPSAVIDLFEKTSYVRLNRYESAELRESVLGSLTLTAV